MFPPFPTELAEKYSHQLISQLENGAPLNDFNGMFGILVCTQSSSSGGFQTGKSAEDDNAAGEKSNGEVRDEAPGEFTTEEIGDLVVLRAFSGQYKSRWNYDGFVPALVEQDSYDRAVAGNDKEIHELSVAPQDETLEQKTERDKKRIALCNETLSKIYSLYSFTCFDGVARDFDYLQKSIQFESGAEKEKLLPTGTGDCAGPKLLSYAFSHGLKPLSLVEFYWGKPNTHLEHKKFYPPCDQKCRFILPAILGLEILYRDEDIIVVNKPSGLLAVPGRGPDRQDCIVSRLRRLFPETIEQPSVHRLDMDTSGLMVLAFNAQAQRTLSIEFQNGSVQKKYIAVLDGAMVRLGEKAGQDGAIAEFSGAGNKDGTLTGSVDEGRLELPFRLDVDNRPHQIYDPVNGKTGITLWRRLRIWKYKGRDVTSVEFTPLTGRTHQLRLASSDPHGFGLPIVGDNLYGHQDNGQRLLLHSTYISFTHPGTGARLEFTSDPPFKY